jgi:hypothetical protein
MIHAPIALLIFKDLGILRNQKIVDLGKYPKDAAD